MNSAEKLLSGSTISLPQLEELDLTTMPVYEQVSRYAEILTDCDHDDILPALRARQAQLQPIAAHALYLAGGVKPFMNNFSIALGDNARYKVWLHAYSENQRSSDGERVYVEQFHNHRHGIASLIIKGGYTADEYRIEDPENHIALGGDVSLEEWTEFQSSLVLQTVTYKPGDVMEIHPDETHRLRELVPGSRTFALETPTTRNFSVVYDDAGAQALRLVHDMAAMRSEMFGSA